MFVEITYEEIYEVWSNRLWPTRTSPIQSRSSMKFLGGYDLTNKQYPARFFGYKVNDKIIAVNSGHGCGDGSYRSRGLWVDYGFRRQGIGKQLLIMTINQAQKENCSFIWSYPKKSSWSTYAAAGFELAGDWHSSELDINAYCIKRLNHDHL